MINPEPNNWTELKDALAIDDSIKLFPWSFKEVLYPLQVVLMNPSLLSYDDKIGFLFT